MFVKCLKLMINLDRVQSVYVFSDNNHLNFQFDSSQLTDTESIKFVSHEAAVRAYYYIDSCLRANVLVCDLLDHMEKEDFVDAYYT